MNKFQNVPVFILAGGLGTRLSEETHLKPKPMVEIGDTPILLHIMRWYYGFGFNDFVICAGYRAWEIKHFFLNYEFRQNHIEIDHRKNVNLSPSALNWNTVQEKWRVRIFDTGQETMTGGRIARAMDHVLGQNETAKLSPGASNISVQEPFTDFAVTYGDGVSDVDLLKEFEFHREHRRIGTVLGVPPVARFGELDVDTGSKVKGFIEKPEDKQGLINGGFFFFKSEFRKYLKTDESCILERAPLTQLALDGELMNFEHKGFWRPMDTLRDKVAIQELWDSGKAPWLHRK